MKLEIEGIGKYHVDYTVPRRAKAQTLELGLVQGNGKYDKFEPSDP